MSNQFLSNLLGSMDAGVTTTIVSDNAKSHARIIPAATTKQDSSSPSRRHDARWSCSSDDLLFITNPRTTQKNKWDQFSSIRTARRNTIPSIQPPLHKRSPPGAGRSVGSRGGGGGGARGLHNKGVKVAGAAAMRI